MKIRNQQCQEDTANTINIAERSMLNCSKMVSTKPIAKYHCTNFVRTHRRGCGTDWTMWSQSCHNVVCAAVFIAKIINIVDDL